jgi:hypothetical protein
MALSTERKSEIVAQFRRDPKDTGSPEVQIALLSERINGWASTSARTSAITPRAAGSSSWSTSAASSSTT